MRTEDVEMIFELSPPVAQRRARLAMSREWARLVAAVAAILFAGALTLSFAMLHLWS